MGPVDTGSGRSDVAGPTAREALMKNTNMSDALLILGPLGELEAASGPLIERLCRRKGIEQPTTLADLLGARNARSVTTQLGTHGPVGFEMDDLGPFPITCRSYPDAGGSRFYLVMIERGAATDTKGMGPPIASGKDIAGMTRNAVVEYDRKGKLIFVGPGFEPMFGYPEGEAMGMSIFDILAIPEDRSIARKMHSMGLEGGPGRFSGIVNARKKDGTTLFLNMEAFLVRTNDEIMGGHAVLHDVTALEMGLRALKTEKERLRTESEKRRELLEESERNFEFLLMNAPIGLFMIQDGVITYMNDHMTSIAGPWRTGREVSGFMDGALDELMEKGLPGQKRALHRALHMKGETGQDLTFDVNMAEISFKGVPTILGILINITEKHQMQSLLVECARSATVGQIASKFAHDINSPLTVIELSTENMRRKVGPALLKKLDNINAQVERIEDMIRNVAHYARKSVSFEESVDINRTLLSVVEWIEAEKKGRTTFQWELGNEVGLINGDGFQLRNMFFNVIISSLDRLEGCGIIRITTTMGEREIHIRVQDDGPPIEEEMIPYVFEPFSGSKSSGYGLGMMVARQIARSHGGDVTMGNVGSSGDTSVHGRYVNINISNALMEHE